MASAESVSTGQSDDILIIETHAAKDVTEVLAALGGVWETSVWGAGSDVLVSTAWAVWDGWAGHLLDGADAGENPEVGVGDPWGFLCKIV